MAGYNKLCEVLPGIFASHDLLDKGPERIYDDQYREQAKAEYGNLMRVRMRIGTESNAGSTVAYVPVSKNDPERIAEWHIS